MSDNNSGRYGQPDIEELLKEHVEADTDLLPRPVRVFFYLLAILFAVAGPFIVAWWPDLAVPFASAVGVLVTVAGGTAIAYPTRK